MICFLHTDNALVKRLADAYTIRRKEFNLDVIKDIAFIKHKVNFCLVSRKVINKKLSIDHFSIELK
jgi:hypothetical protein